MPLNDNQYINKPNNLNMILLKMATQITILKSNLWSLLLTVMAKQSLLNTSTCKVGAKPLLG